MVVAGSLAAAVLAGLEGAARRATALRRPWCPPLGGWGIPKERALTCETHVQGGKFLVMVRGVPWARRASGSILAHGDHEPEHMHLYETSPP